MLQRDVYGDGPLQHEDPGRRLQLGEQRFGKEERLQLEERDGRVSVTCSLKASESTFVDIRDTV